MSIIVGYDATHANLKDAEGMLPNGSLFAGYSTGSPDIMWTPADWARHPGALRIDQDMSASDFTADYLDVENGAATPKEAAAWYQNAYHNWTMGTRPGQRPPAIYVSASRVTELVNTLIADNVKFGPNLVVADWNLSEAQAVADVMNASGPFPIVGVQFKSNTAYDINVFSGTWTEKTSARSMVPAVPPGQWKDKVAWSWREVAIIGTGLDGTLYMYEYNQTANQWVLRAL